MNKKIVLVGANLLAFLILITPVLAFAQEESIKRDAFSAKDVSDRFKNIVNIIAFFAVIATVVFIVIGGFQWMSGDAKEGQSKVKNGIFGLIIVIVAYLLVQLVAGVTQGVKDSPEIQETFSNISKKLL